MAKNNAYVVFIGHKPGVYKTWNECKLQTSGYSGAKFKGFISYDSAVSAFREHRNNTPTPIKESSKPNINYNTISVDGACSGNPGRGEYQCVDTKTGELIFSSHLFEKTTNNLMEFFALVEGLLWLKNNNSNKLIYSDSITAISWVRNKIIKTSLKENSMNKDTFLLIEKYKNVLELEDFDLSRILKWDTKKLGEIKADFGRK